MNLTLPDGYILMNAGPGTSFNRADHIEDVPIVITEVDDEGALIIKFL